ncbi:MAG: Asp-tRNA(Asn)/Glu-tRNA(Gln) amidotransferase subunit GatC [Parcubacteria group bacterium]|nr:Asp-tRNA(Asn)/Glu-tRNA(Gln) amidotransferase subunit GatC [Parcubacteria group bacterium]
MEMITKEDIEKLADLARIEVEEGERERLRSSMEGILDYVSEVGKISDSSASAPDLGTLRNVFREDGEPHEGGAYTDSVLKNAPDTEGGYIKVKKIL